MCLTSTRNRAGAALVASALAMVPLVGCSSSQPPAMVGNEVAAVGMTLKIRTPVKITSRTPAGALFARLEPGQPVAELLKGKRLYASSYIDGKYVYLANVPPGDYVAVAAIYDMEFDPNPVSVGSAGPVGFGVGVTLSLPTICYMPGEFIEATRTSIGAREFGYMGRFVGDESLTFGSPDAYQQHHSDLIRRRSAGLGELDDAFGGAVSLKLSLHERDGSAQARRDFLSGARRAFEGSAWASTIPAD